MIGWWVVGKGGICWPKVKSHNVHTNFAFAGAIHLSIMVLSPRGLVLFRLEMCLD